MVAITQPMYSHTCLDSYLSNKTNGILIRYLDLILQSKTCTDGDFLRGRNTFQGICLRSSQKLLKKLYFSEFVAWLRKAAENFWEVTCTSCMCSKACLDLYLSAKINDMVEWYFKQFLESETCGNGDFRELVLPQERVFRRGFMVIAYPPPLQITEHPNFE